MRRQSEKKDLRIRKMERELNYLENQMEERVAQKRRELERAQLELQEQKVQIEQECEQQVRNKERKCV